MGKKGRARAQEKRKQSKRDRTLLMFGGGVLFVAILAFVTWQQTGGNKALSAESVPDPFLGNETAAVEIVEYGDLGCPACRAWHNSGIREQLVAEYGDQVRFVWRDFPVITADSPKAAEAAQCAGAQGQFWDYHDYIYEEGGSLKTSALKSYAADIGLDETEFNACLDQGWMVKKVQANEQAARRLGLRSTPGFTVNGQPLPAPPSYAQLATLVEQAQ